MFSAINEISRKNESTYITIVSFSIYPASIMYLVVGIIGYLTFGSAVRGNIITMYPYSLSTLIGRLAIVILVLFSYPLQCHPCRASVSNIYHWVLNKYSNDTSNYTTVENDEPEAEVVSQHSVRTVYTSHLETKTHILLTVIILVLSFIMAIKVKSLEVVLAFVGSTGSTSISFILPGLFAYSLLKNQSKNTINPDFHYRFYGSESARYFSKDKVLQGLAIGLFCLGIVVLIVCLGINIWNLL